MFTEVFLTTNFFMFISGSVKVNQFVYTSTSNGKPLNAYSFSKVLYAALVF